jgi:hypothetical protein
MAGLSAEQTLTIRIVVQSQRMAALSPKRTHLRYRWALVFCLVKHCQPLSKMRSPHGKRISLPALLFD